MYNVINVMYNVMYNVINVMYNVYPIRRDWVVYTV